MEKPYTREELKKQLTDLVLQKYNGGVREADQSVADLSQAADPGRLAASLIEAIAEVWGENNRRMEDYIRRVGYGAGGRIR